MQGRYWVGILGAIGAAVIGGAVSLVLPICCGLVGLGATIVIGLIVGVIVPQVDDRVKANPDDAAGAGGIAGLIAGLGGAAGQVLAVVVFAGLLAAAPEGYMQDVFEQMWSSGDYGEYNLEEMDLDMDQLMGLYQTTSLMAGVCYGVVGLAMTAGAGALGAHFSKPARPHMAESSSLPEWGRADDEPPPDDDQ